jgi:hypothetical protein
MRSVCMLIYTVSKELHRRDAVAMERLTYSPYVMDIYGYCGHSALTELAFSTRGLNNLYRLSTELKGVNTPYVLQKKLQIGAIVAFGLSELHNVPVDKQSDLRFWSESETLKPTTNQKPIPASITHYDINPRNVIMTKSAGYYLLIDGSITFTPRGFLLVWKCSCNST